MYFATSQPSLHVCQKIICVWMAYWTLHVKLHQLWFSSSSKCSLHNFLMCQDPVSSSLPSWFELSPTIFKQIYYLQLTFQQLSKSCENPHKRYNSLLPALLHDSGSCVLFSDCHGFAASPGQIIRSHNTVFPMCALEIIMTSYYKTSLHNYRTSLGNGTDLQLRTALHCMGGRHYEHTNHKVNKE